MEPYEEKAEFKCLGILTKTHDLGPPKVSPSRIWGVNFIESSYCANVWSGRSGPANTPACPKCGSIRFVWTNHPLAL